MGLAMIGIKRNNPTVILDELYAWIVMLERDDNKEVSKANN